MDQRIEGQAPHALRRVVAELMGDQGVAELVHGDAQH